MEDVKEIAPVIFQGISLISLLSLSFSLSICISFAYTFMIWHSHHSSTGIVATGFGRGGKLLGCPTANIPLDGNEKSLELLEAGIYLGYALLRGEVYPMCTSIGWNPHFKNEHKTIEPHLIHKFESDFYGEHLKIVVCGYIRGEKSFTSLGKNNNFL